LLESRASDRTLSEDRNKTLATWCSKYCWNVVEILVETITYQNNVLLNDNVLPTG